MTDHIVHHTVGTHIDDLSQIYNGRVSIKGSVKLKNISFLPVMNNEDSQQMSQSQIVINNTPFDLLSLHQQYWFKTIDQVFKWLQMFLFSNTQLNIS